MPHSGTERLIPGTVPEGSGREQTRGAPRDHERRAKCLLEIVLPLPSSTMTSGSMSVVSFSVEPSPR